MTCHGLLNLGDTSAPPPHPAWRLPEETDEPDTAARPRNPSHSHRRCRPDHRDPAGRQPLPRRPRRRPADPGHRDRERGVGPPGPRDGPRPHRPPGHQRPGRGRGQGRHPARPLRPHLPSAPGPGRRLRRPPRSRRRLPQRRPGHPAGDLRNLRHPAGLRPQGRRSRGERPARGQPRHDAEAGQGQAGAGGRRPARQPEAGLAHRRGRPGLARQPRGPDRADRRAHRRADRRLGQHRDGHRRRQGALQRHGTAGDHPVGDVVPAQGPDAGQHLHR